MAITPDNEEPGFETDVNELPKDRNSSEHSTEDNPKAEDEAAEMEHVQEEAAEERKEGGYQ
jgi:hypothetical protein